MRLGNSVSALGMNVGKGLVALLCLGVVVLPSGLAAPAGVDLMLLALSGLLGICVGDTLYFLTLQRLGPRLTLLLTTLVPVATVVAAVVLLGERIGGWAWLGLALALAGVAYVLWERSPQQHRRQRFVSGLSWGAAFILVEAAAILLTKVGVVELPALDATLIRQAAALMGLAVWLAITRSFVRTMAPLNDRRLLVILVVGAVVGAFLGTWLSVLGLKYTYAAVAATLNATSPLFVLPMAVLVLKESVSARAVVGAVVAVGGVAVYFATLGGWSV